MIWSAQQLSEALGVVVDKNIRAGEVQFNSKDVKKGNLFIALPGSSDGHNYVKDALSNGAAAVVVSKLTPDLALEKQILVEDTKQALNKLANFKRSHSKAKFIGVTGSMGKTSTKEAFSHILANFGKTFASRGNFNNFLGVPINLASMPDDADFCVFEIGMNAPGEIRPLTKMVKPDIAIITNIAPVHIEFFPSLKEIADAKAEIFEGLSDRGVAIINKDNEFYDYLRQILTKLSINNVYSFGSKEKADFQLVSYRYEGSYAYLEYQNNEQKFITKSAISGKHQAINLAAVLEAVSILQLDVGKACESLINLGAEAGRGRRFKAFKNGKNLEIIDDSYNASPEAVKASLAHLKDINHPSKVIILADMRELGPRGPEFHSELVPYILDSGATKVFTVGELMNNAHINLPDSVIKWHFKDYLELKDFLMNELKDGDLILVKGSKSMKLASIVEYLSEV